MQEKKVQNLPAHSSPPQNDMKVVGLDLNASRLFPISRADDDCLHTTIHILPQLPTHAQTDHSSTLVQKNSCIEVMHC